ncbi:MAG: hypothetical protein ACI9W2_001013 [Gammaproteobacteria bacterium]|jgi:hypothetical protein
MQGRVPRRLPHLVTVSASSRDDIISVFGVNGEVIDVIPIGVDAQAFHPMKRTSPARSSAAHYHHRQR